MIGAFSVLERWLGRDSAVVALSFCLLAPLAVAKSATACGVNVIGTFAVLQQPRRGAIARAAVYVVSSTLAATLLGSLGSAMKATLGLSGWLPLAGPPILYLGLRELGYWPNHPYPPLVGRFRRLWLRTQIGRRSSGASSWVPV